MQKLRPINDDRMFRIMAKKVKRLFEQFRPEHYDLFLHPDKEKLVFSGKVKIKGFKSGKPSKRITLHQKDLKVISASVIHKDKKGDKKLNIRINHHKAYDEVRLHTENLIYPGIYEIELEFEGKITPQFSTMYLSKFEEKGKKLTLTASWFKSHHAREVFPCIDEPEAEATFRLNRP